MIHIFQRGKNELSTTLILLHGTGGNEYDLLPYASYLDQEANILSIRGNVSEHGMNRFFRRIKEGVFDQVDLAFRTKELLDFIEEASQLYHFSLERVVLVGYSNGSNIASSILLSYVTPYQAALLHHPMVPFRKELDIELSSKKILIIAGTNDPICSTTETEELFSMYLNLGSLPTLLWTNQGHQLTKQEMSQAKLWYEKEIMNK
jgi:phospholipase/carboxylesterase